MSNIYKVAGGSSGGPIITLSAEGGSTYGPTGGNFNFSGTVLGGYGSLGAIVFSASAGELNGQVQVDGTTIGINASNQLTVVNGGFKWLVQTTNVAVPTADTGYFADGAMGPTGITVTLPAVAAVGFTFKVYNFNGNGFEIAQNAGQFIQIGMQATTTGASGNIISTQIGDMVEIVCSVANTQFEAVSYNGNLIIN